MEISQTIWTALTSENEVLINHSNILLSVIEATVTMLLFTTILNINATKKSKLHYVLIFSFLAIISILFIPVPYNTYVNVLLCPILVLIIFKENLLKSILAEIIPFAFFTVIGTVILNLCLKLFNTTVETYQIIPIYKIVGSLLTYFCIYLMYIFFKKFNIILNIIDSMKRKNSFIFLLNFTIGIIAICTQSYLFTLYSDKLPFFVIFISVLVLLIYFIISFYSLIRTNKLEKVNQDLEQEKLVNKTLTIMHDNIRGFRHDFNNIVQVIGGYVSTNDLDGLKKYYSDLVGDCQKINNLTLLNPSVINNPAIYSLLTAKYHTADEKGIKINLTVKLDLSKINMKIYEFTRILGILLDNAIEACSECEEKYINILMSEDDKSPRQLFIIENTYLNKDINIDRIFDKDFTTKVGNTGLGLWEVRTILKKNNNLNLYTTKTNNLFKQQLEIYL